MSGTLAGGIPRVAVLEVSFGFSINPVFEMMAAREPTGKEPRLSVFEVSFGFSDFPVLQTVVAGTRINKGLEFPYANHFLRSQSFLFSKL